MAGRVITSLERYSPSGGREDTYRLQSITAAKPQFALFSLIRRSPMVRRRLRCRPGWAGSSSPGRSER